MFHHVGTQLLLSHKRENAEKGQTATENGDDWGKDTGNAVSQVQDTDNIEAQAQDTDNAGTERRRETEEEEEHVNLILEPVNVEETRGEREIQQRGRKRKRDPDNWKKNVRKRLRNTGQSYVNSKNIHIPVRKVRGKDCASCRYKCNHNFPQSVREVILDQFWAMGDVARQKDFIINHTVTKLKKRQTSHTESKRQNTIEYQLTTQGKQI